MIVGKEIIERKLIAQGTETQLKNSTYDLTIGEIIPIDKNEIKKRRSGSAINAYFIEPREMVWVLSKESFSLPADVTGLATLRTSFTKEGLLALNVGIIDPMFHGPISTALINFSDVPRLIEVGDKFFRVAFFGHADTTPHHRINENKERNTYLREIEEASYAQFSKSFLNIPDFNDDFYHRKFWSIIWYGVKSNRVVFWGILTFLAIFIWYWFEQGFLGFLLEKLAWLNSQRDNIGL